MLEKTPNNSHAIPTLRRFLNFLYSFLIILATVGLFSCKATTCVPFVEKEDEEEFFFSDARREITRIITIYAIELKQMLCMTLENSYIMHDDFGFHIWVDWKSQDNLDIEETRRLFVSVVEGLLDRLNYDEELKSMTGNFVFSPDYLYLSIEFESFFGKYIDPLYVARIDLEEGIVSSYYAHDAFDVKTPVYHKHYEPYETSLLIVQTQRGMWAMQEDIRQNEITLEKEKTEYLRLLRQGLERRLRTKYKIDVNPPIPALNRLPQTAPYGLQRNPYPVAPPLNYPNPYLPTYPNYPTNPAYPATPYPAAPAYPNNYPTNVPNAPNGASPAYQPSNNPYPQQGQDYLNPAPYQPFQQPGYNPGQTAPGSPQWSPSITVPSLQPLNPV